MSLETQLPPISPPPFRLRLPDALTALATEIATYRRELLALVGAGDEGRFALVKGDAVLSIWDTYGDACQAGHQAFGLDEPFMVHRILVREADWLNAIDLTGVSSSCRS